MNRRKFLALTVLSPLAALDCPFKATAFADANGQENASVSYVLHHKAYYQQDSAYKTLDEWPIEATHTFGWKVMFWKEGERGQQYGAWTYICESELMGKCAFAAWLISKLTVRPDLRAPYQLSKGGWIYPTPDLIHPITVAALGSTLV